MPLPPRWVRRTVIAPAVVLGAIVLVTTLPLWLLGAAAATSLVPGRLRLPRILWLVTFYLVWNSAALVAMFVLWLASGVGWKLHSPAFERAHYVLAGWFLRLLFIQARWVLRLRIELRGDQPSQALDEPIIVASRHGGPGDSFILIHLLINQYRREPRIVLKDTLQWDPAIDVLLNRLPNQFIAPTPFDPTAKRPVHSLASEVGELAEGLDENDAFVIFPEGGQFTSSRRRRRIARLRQQGRAEMAERAAAMRHVMAPRPGGIVAALHSAPGAGVVFVAHTGLERLATVGDMWRELPMDKQITVQGWHVPATDIPSGDAERVEWLYTWWEHIDRWIAEHHEEHDEEHGEDAAADAGEAVPG